MRRRVLERAAIERRHLEEAALLDGRRRDLESAIDPTVPKTMKGPDAPTESERIARELTHLPLAPDVASKDRTGHKIRDKRSYRLPYKLRWQTS